MQVDTSTIDAQEAFMVGEGAVQVSKALSFCCISTGIVLSKTVPFLAVQAAAAGTRSGSAAIKRISDSPYKSEPLITPLDTVAKVSGNVFSLQLQATPLPPAAVY
eukprot:SAG22_NODE_953_length_6332_cov_5.830258_1_plen_105_part_00